MSAEAKERDAVLAWDPGIGGAVISIPVETLSHEGGATSIARVGVEDDRTFLEQEDGLRILLAEIALEDALEALHMGVVMVREFEDEGEGRTREYHVESLAHGQALGM